MTLHTESIADQTDHFADIFVRENIAHDYEVVTKDGKYTADAILFREIRCKKTDNLMF